MEPRPALRLGAVVLVAALQAGCCCPPEVADVRATLDKCDETDLVHLLDTEVTAALASPTFVPDDGFRRDWSGRVTGWERIVESLLARSISPDLTESSRTMRGYIAAARRSEDERKDLKDLGDLRAEVDKMKEAVGPE